MTGEYPCLTVEVTSALDTQTIVLAGEADLVGAPEIEAAFKDACAREPGLVVLDLKDLTFIDSSGLRSLITGHQLCSGRGHELKIIPGPANVQRIFELAGMNDALPFCEAEPS